MAENMNKRNLVVTFTHTNYCLHSSGTEKFVRDYLQQLNYCGYNNLVFFPIDPRNSETTKLTGVIMNDCFIGLYKYEHIFKIINNVVNINDLDLKFINIQHLKNQNLKELKRIIEQTKIPVNLFIHDFYSLCSNFRMIDSNGEACGATCPGTIKCSECAEMERGISHYKKINCFYESIAEYVDRVIVPSKFVEKSMLQAFPEFMNKIYVRPHLTLSGCYKREQLKDNEKIKVAYIGAQIKDKGYLDWKIIVDELKNSDLYEFYYFGFGTERIDNVRNIYVAGSKQKKRMDDYLKEYRLCLFMEPLSRDI